MKSIDSSFDFLNLVYKDMSSSIKSDFINSSDRISYYLNSLETFYDVATTDSYKMNLLRDLCYEKYLIKSLPESYVRLKKGYIKELGLDSIKEQQTKIENLFFSVLLKNKSKVLING